MCNFPRQFCSIYAPARIRDQPGFPGGVIWFWWKNGVRMLVGRTLQVESVFRTLKPVCLTIAIARPFFTLQRASRSYNVIFLYI
jgi:hypothetical protein